MAYVVLRDREQMAILGLSSIAHIPFLLSRDMAYLDEANRFLRERSNGAWHPNNRDGTAYGLVRALSTNSVLAYANDLKNFWSYCEVRRLRWQDITYQQLLDTYDKDMSAGKWRAKGKMSLAAATINRRMRTAVEFLLWAADRKLRPQFLVLQSRSRGRGTAHGPWTSARNLIDSRVGIHRVNPKRLRLPSSEKINLWLEEVRVTHGRARHLACKFILQTGCRLEEAANARVWQLPDPSEINLDMPARMDIIFGTKGQRSPEDPHIKGKPRSLRFNRSFACELNNYKQLGRKKAVANWREKNEGEPASDFLFLDDKTGKPLSRQAIYRAWTNTKRKPIESWTPHLGRHAFACYELLRLINDENKLIANFTESMPRSQIMLRTENLISIFLRPVLGHIDDGTSERYTEWIADHLWVAEHRRDWTNYLEENVDV